MARQIELKANTRTETGRNAIKRLRAKDVVPGVVYGGKEQTLNIALSRRELEQVLHHVTGANVLINLQVAEGGATKNRLALIKEVQQHPVTDEILHVDFHEISATQKLRTSVPVRAVGEPAGAKEGGVLEFVMRELRVECSPKDLPEAIEVNVEALAIGQTIQVGAVIAPAGVTLLDNKDQAVFTVAAPMAEEEVVVAPVEGAAAEPEVITAKKAEGEEGEEGEEAEGEGKAGGKAKGKAEAGKGEAKPATAGGAAAKPGAKPADGKPATAGKPWAKAGATPTAGAKADGKPATAHKPEGRKK
jgi:large subunit ribosomal protein L25